MLVCREAASAGAIGEREGESDSLWATDSRREESEATRCWGNTIEEAKESFLRPWCKVLYCSRVEGRRSPSC